ncbi:MAG: sulfotransferase [Candidatus Melainabacteria bacterium]|nr:sulfotransferase [Candidatus Melainabacteria bacterium]MBI3307981.1 sulfotransferase [Candidatus Melainabacteria bacterium]
MNEKLTKQKLSINETTLNPPIFICGEGRSGTRLIRNLLGKHKNIFEIQRETYIYGTKSIRSQKLFDRFEKNKIFDQLTLAILTAMHYKKDITYKKIKSKDFDHLTLSLFNEINKLKEYTEAKSKYDCFNLCANYLTYKNSKLRWVEKTPSNIYNTDAILDSYPNAKIIAIYRDPRAVCLSWQKKDKSKSLLGSAISWNSSMKTMLGNLQTHKRNIISVKYEDLIIKPEETIKMICTFINEDYEPAMLEDIKVVNTYFDDSKKIGLDTTPITRWKSILKSNEKLFIDCTTRKYRQIVGYEDSNSNSSSSLYLNLAFYSIFETIKLIIKKTSKLLKNEI